MSEENWIRFNNNVKLAFLDFETFNLNLSFKVNRPWQAGVLKVQGNDIIDTIDVRINWKDCLFEIGKGAIMQTHFNKEEHDKLAVDPKTAFDKIWPAIVEADFIIGHNLLRFDLYLLRGYAQYMGKDWKFILPKIIDTKSVFQGIKLNRPFKPGVDDFMEYQYRMANDKTKGVKTRLEILGKEYDIEHDYTGLHNALNDLQLNVKLWNKLKFQIEI